MTTTRTHKGLEVACAPGKAQDEILAPEALDFLVALQREFNPRRLELLHERKIRQQAIDRGELPRFLAETKQVRQSDWQVDPVPADLQDRRVEITGPTDRKMVINALNSGARCYLADFEDAHSPTWNATLDGQINVRDAVRG
ncbi:MAG TPA: malate synthase A, partial [Candidatus Binatia bacterium]|nr:malate synthase A [Candidatus Binatia bacterium]